MQKLDLKKHYRNLYSPMEKITTVIVPAFNYLMIDGKGEPDGTEAQAAIKVLFPVAYKIKFACKKRGNDFSVMPLEGLWWAEDMNDFVNGKRNKWKWTYMIMQPDFVTKQDFEDAVNLVKEKDKNLILPKLIFEKYVEGKAAQMLHKGPYSAEGPNIQMMHEFIKNEGGKFDGHIQKHHEIYLSDARKTLPEKMRTILRQPFI